jgi:thiamine-monophosphate kinase
MAERDRIARYFAPLAAAETGSFDLRDDAACLTPPAGQSLVITTDSVIESIHVLAHSTPQQFAQKLMRRNLSDLAAMGATPWRYTLNLHTPTGLADDWFADFAATLSAEQRAFNLTLIGGDSTSGGDTIHTTMTCFGLVAGSPLRRNGASHGDDIYVSGTLGDAAYALFLLQQHIAVEDALAARYHCPNPRLELGNMLHGIATSAIDISDGLVADIEQICNASACAARIEASALPLSSHLQNAAISTAQKIQFALSGGDDYELCFTAPQSMAKAIAALSKTLRLPITRIGEITQGNGVEVLDENGAMIRLAAHGFEHG